MLLTKSVHSPIDHKRDGLRILATRVRGRGLLSSAYDVWMANLGPSEQLLTAGRAEEISWREFTSRYRNEILTSTDVDSANVNINNHGQKFTLRLIKHLAKSQTVTLLCHCDEDQKRCHRHILKAMIESTSI